MICFSSNVSKHSVYSVYSSMGGPFNTRYPSFGQTNPVRGFWDAEQRIVRKLGGSDEESKSGKSCSNKWRHPHYPHGSGIGIDFSV
ncbi:hypothetical protein Scep_019935 [Stephania cephalantha]|uniref:Uncharacterized protein n=1 Tax=Stephania cephalantha TaxID=152367 RepID=A0AAP0IBM0_9MAGN